MRLTLHQHPDSASGAVDRIEVELARSRDRTVSLRYACLGPLKHLELPRPAHRPRRLDGLWQHSCFELFIGPAGADEYLEFNLSPSRDWACYRFDRYRSGMTSPREVSEPRIETWLHLPRPADRVEGVRADHAGIVRNFAEPFFDLTAIVDLGSFDEMTLDRAWRLGLSAVIEERNGHKSYWALAHPGGSPDFHHSDCFALELPAARPA